MKQISVYGKTCPQYCFTRKIIEIQIKGKIIVKCYGQYVANLDLFK